MQEQLQTCRMRAGAASGVDKARDEMRSGRALEKLEALVAFSRQVRPMKTPACSKKLL